MKFTATRVFTISSILIAALVFFFAELPKELDLFERVGTDNAYIHGHLFHIGSPISGIVEKVYVNEFDSIEEGQLLVKLSDKELIASLERTVLELDVNNQAIISLDSDEALQKKILEQAQSNLKGLEELSEIVNRERRRSEKLFKSNALGQSDFDAATYRAKELENEIKDVSAQIDIESAKLHVIYSKKAMLVAEGEVLRKNIEVKKYNINKLNIVAPYEGTIGRLHVHSGSWVSEGDNVLSIADSSALWVEANFKESQLLEISIGDEVFIYVDAIPDRKLFGSVEQISPATASEFSFLPLRKNSGTFTKTIQRVPVKISIDEDNWKSRLRIGMSVEVELNR
ncbi:unnamed protein product [Ectocarpus fasciculatus]